MIKFTRWMSCALGILGLAPHASVLAQTNAQGLALSAAGPDQARLVARGLVAGPELDSVRIEGKATSVVGSMSELWRQPRPPAPYTLRFEVPADATALSIPSCGHRGAVRLAGVVLPAADAGPVVVRIPAASAPRELSIELAASEYERRIACTGAPRAGALVANAAAGFYDLYYVSPHATACRGACTPGHALVYVPEQRQAAALPLLVGVHPWNGSMFTYAAYRQLIDHANRLGLALLLPSGLGNSMYSAPAEAEVMLAMGALAQVLSIDQRRISIFGASMGGQGATTIAFHHPDRFAFVASLFGDARLPRRGYLLNYFPTDLDARRVNPADAGDNARHLPTWLLHGDADRTSPVTESDTLFRELGARGYPVHFDRLAGRGHEGKMVEEYAAGIATYAALLRAPTAVSRLTYRALRPADSGAYGVRVVRRDPACEAFVDVGYDQATSVWNVYAADNVAELRLQPGAFGLAAVVTGDVGAPSSRVRVVPDVAPRVP
jgi:pimeloyl-ACP methyl ester carboxylesterase